MYKILRPSLTAPLLLAFIATLAAPACKREEAPKPAVISFEEAVKKHRAAVEPKLAKARVIGQTKLPRTVKAAATLESGSSIKVIDNNTAGGEDGNATIVHIEDLAGMKKDDKLTFRMEKGTGVLIRCAEYLAEKSGEGPWADKALTDCEHLKYLLVIRYLGKVDPKVNARKTDASDEELTYTPGKVDGDVLVFDLESGKHLGGYPIEAKLDDSTVHIQRGVTNPFKEGFHRELSRSIEEGFTMSVGGTGKSFIRDWKQ